MRSKIVGSRFTKKEITMFRKQLQMTNTSREISKIALVNLIHASAKRSLRDILSAFFIMIFFQVPFIVSSVINKNLDFQFIFCAIAFSFYMVIYVTARVRGIPVCTQCKLIKLAIAISFDAFF